MHPIGPVKSIRYSSVLHVVALSLTLFGLPAIFPERIDPEPFVMTVEIVPISEITNLPSKQTPIKRIKAEPTPAPKPKPAAKIEPKPTPKINETPLPPPEPEPKPKEALKEAVEPIQKPKEESKKTPEKPKKDDALAALLNQLKQESEAAEEKRKKPEQQEEDAGNTTKSNQTYDPSIPLSISEKDAIKSQFIHCWRVPAGARDAHTLAVQVQLSLSPDGSVRQAELARGQLGRYQSDPFFRAAADSAIRAVWKCSPIQHLPADKYDSWREMELTFDPREMLF